MFKTHTQNKTLRIKVFTYLWFIMFFGCKNCFNEERNLLWRQKINNFVVEICEHRWIEMMADWSGYKRIVNRCSEYVYMYMFLQTKAHVPAGVYSSNSCWKLLQAFQAFGSKAEGAIYFLLRQCSFPFDSIAPTLSSPPSHSLLSSTAAYNETQLEIPFKEEKGMSLSGAIGLKMCSFHSGMPLTEAYRERSCFFLSLNLWYTNTVFIFWFQALKP